MKKDSVLSKLARSNGIGKNKFDYRRKIDISLPRFGRPSITGLVRDIKRFRLQICIGISVVLLLIGIIYLTSFNFLIWATLLLVGILKFREQFFIILGVLVLIGIVARLTAIA